MKLIPPKYRRGVRLAKYSFLTLAGAVMFAVESAVLTNAVGVMLYGWAVFLFAGGSACILGVITDWWLGEFVGTVAIAFVMAMLSLVLTVDGISGPSLARVTFGLIFASFTCWVIARFVDIWNTAAGSKAVNGE